MAAQERRQQASEYALLLKQQEQELQAVREELVAVKQTVRTEEEGRVAAERKAEEAQIQLSVERSNHMKLQKVMRAPRRTRLLACACVCQPRAWWRVGSGARAHEAALRHHVVVA